MQSHYRTLGVKPDATKAEIRTAYLRLAKLKHGDRPGGNQEEFKQLLTAYKCLSDDKKRAEYNSKTTARDISSSQDPESKINITQEEFKRFEEFARKILHTINPNKEYIYIGEAYNITRFDHNRFNMFEIGCGESSSIKNLNLGENFAFLEFIDLFLSRHKEQVTPIPENECEGHSRLRYEAKTVKEILRLLDLYEKELPQYLDNFLNGLIYQSYLKKIILDKKLEVFSIKYCFSFTTKGLQLNLPSGTRLSKDAIQRADFITWLHKEGIKPISEDIYGFQISWNDMNTQLNQEKGKKIRQKTLRDQRVNHFLDSTKNHIEEAKSDSLELIAMELEKLSDLNISFKEIQEIAAQNCKDTPLMCAVRTGTNVEFLKKIITLNKDAHDQSGYKNAFLIAVKYSSLEVVEYLDDKMDCPDLNSLKDDSQCSLLRDVINSIEPDHIPGDSSWEAIEEDKLSILQWLIDRSVVRRATDKRSRNEKIEALADNRLRDVDIASASIDDKKRDIAPQALLAHADTDTAQIQRNFYEIYNSPESDERKRKAYIDILPTLDEQQILQDISDMLYIATNPTAETKATSDTKLELNSILQQLDALLLNINKSEHSKWQKKMLGYASDSLREVRANVEQEISHTILRSLVVATCILVALSVASVAPLFIAIAASVSGLIALTPGASSARKYQNISNTLHAIAEKLEKTTPDPSSNNAASKSHNS